MCVVRIRRLSRLHGLCYPALDYERRSRPFFFFYISDGIAKKKQKCAEKKGTGKARAFQGENIKKSMSLA